MISSLFLKYLPDFSDNPGWEEASPYAAPHMILRLRQAQAAMESGHLDEAFAIVRNPEVAAARGRAKLIRELAHALAARAKAHYMADRHPLALANCEKAAELAGNLPETI